MRLLIALWHDFLADIDAQELAYQSHLGSSSSEWAVNVIRCINWRRSEAERLRANSRTLRLIRQIGARYAH